MSAHSELRIASSHGDYSVVLGPGRLADAVEACQALVVDQAVVHLLPPNKRPAIVLTADEQAKTLSGVENLITAMRERGLRRGDHLLAVGGGVVQDLATFSSAVYMRGLDWTYAPTTLMAMADSCIGGKSSINVGAVKNLVGNFHPPQQLVIDPVFLPSLSTAAVSAGLAEAAKIAYCRNGSTFDEYLRLYAAFDQYPIDLISHVLDAKRWFVEVDEHDRAERRLLNFGHTFGHALEVATHHRLSHGLAVAIGMLCAVQHPAAERTSATDALEQHCLTLLSVVDDLPERLTSPSWGRFEVAFRSDKKHDAEHFRIILPCGEDDVTEVVLPADAAQWEQVTSTVGRVLESLGRRS